MTRASFGVGSLLVALLLAAPAPTPAQEVDLSGTYQCEGSNPDGRPYRGIVEITKTDKTYRVVWRMQSGSVGIGIVQGDALAVSYVTGGSVGIVLYRIERGGRLVGEWTLFGADKLFPEILTKRGVPVSDPGPHDAKPGSVLTRH